MKFTYRWGQRPLEGFTIKRGLGQGGFGEVYFAVSDGGKEVALKMLLRGRTDTELRGISNCLNLKHPHLVHLYDLRTDDRGDHWLAMEYVQGEPLSSLLNRNPKGLPADQAREWFLQVAEAVAYLHDHAVIHRDIKPGNVFVEDGILKLGDYGLSKVVSATQLNQSVNVGTVYYMAPEVGKGACTKQVDIYALGVMFYEMLTGEVPFRGDSWAEVALRHQTDTPELANVPPDYLAILQKALHKKPELRYAEVSDMIRDVEGLMMPAIPVNRAPENLLMTLPASPVVPPPVPFVGRGNAKPDAGMVARREPPPVPKRVKYDPNAFPSVRERIAELAFSLAWAPVAGVFVVAAWTVVSAIFNDRVNWYTLMPMFGLTVTMSWLVIVACKMQERKKKGPGGWTLFGIGLLVGVLAFWLEGWTLPVPVEKGTILPAEERFFAGHMRADPGSVRHLVAYPLFFGVAVCMMSWFDQCNRRRRERFSLGPVFGTGVAAFFCWLGWNIFMSSHPSPPTYMFVAIVGVPGVLQLVSPWMPIPKSASKKYRLENV
jgi:eukaryotic-like serine/threonine-protein kinase